MKEGTSAVLLQSGLDENWSADCMECYADLRNIQDLLSDGKTPYERRFGQPFEGPIIPFGSLVEYHLVTAKDQSRIHQVHHQIRLRILSCGRVSENHRGPEVPEVRAQWWPGGWGPQGMPLTGGGGLARVPNLRVCHHPFGLWGGTCRGGKDELTSCRGNV